LQRLCLNETHSNDRMVGLSNDEARKTIEHYNKTIFALECLVRVVTKAKSDSSIPVTLNVHGTLISGKLVSVINYHKYLTHTLLDDLKQKDDPKVYEPIKNAFEALEEVPILDEQDNFILSYVCLQDAKIFLTHVEVTINEAKIQKYTPTMSVPFWIGKIESVDGFFLGETEEDPSTQSLV
jgi:hypothetical protein